jgi:hypothetical protein
MLALADKAIREKGLEYLIIHGVQRIEPNWGYQDFWALKQDVFLPLLDGLKQRSDRGELWITDHITSHQYQAERDGGEVRVLHGDDRELRLALTSKADPKLYDLPLTLVASVPAPWTSCQVVQGTRRVTVTATNNTVRFDAIPNREEIVIRPVGSNESAKPR